MLLPLACVAGALAASPAAAQDPETSANVKHIANIPFPLRYDSTESAGSDLEFATLTIAGPPAAAPPVAPPARQTKAKKKTTKRSTAYSRCVKKASRKKGAKRRAALKKCRKLKAKSRAKAKRSSIDVDAKAPGVQRTYAFMGSYNNGLQIIDVSDPVAPKLANSYDCGIAQGDVQVFTRDDFPGRTFAAFASDDGYAFQADSQCFLEATALGFDPVGQDGDGTFIIDVTDPLKPFTVSFVHFAKGSHNQTVHPSGKYLYNSNSDLLTDTDPGIEVVDITSLGAPKESAVVKLTPMPGLGSDSHDISFSPDGKRAYSAAVSQGVVLDTTDPAKPTVISTIFDPSVNVWHQAEVVDVEVPGRGKRTVLIASDEFAGATGTGQCPNGGLHMYDVSADVEKTPIKLGYFNIDTPAQTDDGVGTCTSHVYQLHREAQLMVIAWYNQGFRVLDTSALAGIAFGGTGIGLTEVASGRITGGSEWAAKSPVVTRDGEFTVYGNDRRRGLDAWRVSLKGGAAQYRRPAGTFHLPGSEPQLKAGAARGIAFVCLLGAGAA
jgi:hypothetical protein